MSTEVLKPQNDQNQWQDPEKTPGLIIPVLEHKCLNLTKIIELKLFLISKQDSSGQFEFSFSRQFDNF